MKPIILAVALLASLGAAARADVGRATLDQDVALDSYTVTAVTLGTTFVQVDTPKLAYSWLVEVQNLSTERVCCTFDSLQVGGNGSSCQMIDTAATAARASANDWKRWKRWATSLSLFCRSMKGSGGTAAIVVGQGR